MLRFDAGGCCRKAREDKLAVQMVFHREELLYDIKNYAYIEGHAWGDENQHAQHTLVDIGEEGNIDRVNRILGVVHSAATEMLYPYTKVSAIDDEVVCDRMRAPKEYVILMRVPKTMSRTTLYLLNDLIHEFMVARVIHDWLSITHPEAAQNWLDKAREAQEEINSVKNCRTGVLTRPAHPF